MKSSILATLSLFLFVTPCVQSQTYHPPLANQWNQVPLNSTTKKLVVCVHGWNYNGSPDAYAPGSDWATLVSAFTGQLLGTDWQLLLYDWKEDANTGFFDFDPLNGAVMQDAIRNATEAATRADAWHGPYLAQQLNAVAPNLRQVHFIGHSAGSWLARKAAIRLLELNPYVTVQVTLSDPFIPGSIGWPWTPVTSLGMAAMNSLASDTHQDRIYRLENYWAEDLETVGTDNPSFAWRPAIDILGRKVNWDLVLAWRYEGHSGPLLFYADTVSSSVLGTSAPRELLWAPFQYNDYGWFKSIFYQAPFLPRITAQPHGPSTPANDGTTVTLSVAANSSQPLSYQWFFAGQPISGANGSSYSFMVSLQTTLDDYVVKVSNVNGAVFSDAAHVTRQVFYAPTISFVSPTQLLPLPLPQTQALHIYGSQFTSSSTLVFVRSASVFNSVPARLTFVSANEIDYDIIVDAGVGNWTVKVVNGAQESNLGNFTVVAPPPPTSGSLTVSLQPAGAVAAGAQWRVDGGSYRNTGDTAISLTPGTHTVSFKSVSGYTTPADKFVSITSGANTTDSGTYTVITRSTYTLTLNYDPAQGGASPSPLVPETSYTYGSYSFGYTAGSVTLVQASASAGYHFTGWSGDASGTANPTTITMNGNKSVTANFASGDANLGTMILTILPPAAAVAGVQWGWNADDYRNSGTSVTTYPGTFIFTIHPVDGWLGPNQKVVTLTAGQTTNVSVTFTQDTTPGLLTVTLSPPDAVTAGAKWRVNGGTAQGSGAAVSLPPGTNYAVTFDAVPGWTAPASRTVTVQRAQTTVAAGNYTPPAGQPVIASVHPSFGALAGGTALTIEGVNFTAPVTVLIGGKPATNVIVLSGSQIACLTPSNFVYGTVPVVVQTSGGNATNVNGFAYGIERGSGIELVSATGGSVNAVAVQGNYAYVGEGSSLMVVDVSNPASPSPVGRLAMPGMVNKVALSGQYAFVANDDAGLQVVDVSTPSVPKLVGFYDTPGISAGIAVSGTNAFVADGDGGFLIFDTSTPNAPVLLSATGVGGSVQDVVVNGGFAYVVFPGTLVIVGVTKPTAPIVRGHVTLPDSISRSLAVSGSRVFVANADGGLRIIDVSSPDAPTDLGRASSVLYPLSVAVSGNLVVAGSAYNAVMVSSYAGGTMTYLGATYGVSSGGYYLAVSGSRAYVPGGTGFSIVDISTPASPSLSGSFSGRSGLYGWVSLSANYLYACFDGAMSGLKIFDVTNPALPTQVGQYDGIGGSSGQVLVTNGVAYINGYGTETRILNVVNPVAPTLLNTIPVTIIYATRIALSGNILFVVGRDTSNNGKFTAFDVTTPSSPVQRGQVTFTSPNQLAVSVAVNGNKAVVRFTSGELKVLDISNVNAPVVTGALTNTGNTGDIVMSADGHFAFVADGTGNNFRVVDVGTPTSPIQVASIPLASRPVALSVRSNSVYVAGAVGVLAFDVSVPSSPVLTRFYTAPSRGSGPGYGVAVARDAARSRDVIYTGDYVAGLVVLQTKDTEVPNIQITAPTTLPVYTNAIENLNLAGSASDNVGVTRVTWLNDRGGGGNATGTNSWSVDGIMLQPGTNVLTATAFDLAGNSGSDTLTVVYRSPKQTQTITFPAIADHSFGDTGIPLVAASSSGLTVNFNVVSGLATLSGNLLTLTGAGGVTVHATQPGNDLFNAAPPVDVSFNVVKADQAISFGLLPDRATDEPPFLLSATASSGLLVAFSIVSGPAVLDTNVVTLLGGGVMTVSAWQPGNSNYNAAVTVQRTFNVAKIPQTISFGPLSRQTLGDAPFPLAASANSGLPVSFSLLSGPAVLSGSIMTVTNTGLVVVRASQMGDSVYASAAPVDQSLVVAAGNNMITDYWRLPNGKFTLVFAGDFDRPYVVECSTNLSSTNWLPLTTNLVDSLGNLEFTDSSATNRAQGFYRVKGP